MAVAFLSFDDCQQSRRLAWSLANLFPLFQLTSVVCCCLHWPRYPDLAYCKPSSESLRTPSENRSQLDMQWFLIPQIVHILIQPILSLVAHFQIKVEQHARKDQAFFSRQFRGPNTNSRSASRVAEEVRNKTVKILALKSCLKLRLKG
jgi:hypothetical protein